MKYSIIGDKTRMSSEPKMLVKVFFAKLILVNLENDRFLRNYVLAGPWRLELGVETCQVVTK